MRLSTFLGAAAGGAAIATASTLKPPVIPLIVRNPYLSTWLGNARDVPWERWPTFWTGQELGLSVLVSVPSTDTVYPLLGRPHDSFGGCPSTTAKFNCSFPSYQGATFDASTTNLTYTIPSANSSGAPLEIILSFLSPITPTSTLRQSIPASYLTVHVSGGFDINLYIDINGMWVSANRGNQIEWSLSEFGPANQKEAPLKTWKVKRRIEQLLTEDADRAEWGTLHFTGPSDTRYEAGESAILRNRFSQTGKLQNVVDGNFRGIMDQEPVFAFSKSFQLNQTSWSTSHSSALFTIAHTQDPVIQFASARGMTLMRPFWAAYYATPDILLNFHYHDFKTAFSLASNYSLQLENDALLSGSEDYKDILALSARQVLGATSFAGTPESPLIFYKEISSDGNMNTIDVIYPSFPFFLYTNPRWLAYVLEPLIEHQLSGQYPNDYSMHDLGSSFPNATGHPDGRDEYMPVEECGNMLIMGLALVNSLKYDTQPASIWQKRGNHVDVDETTGNAFPLTIDIDGMDDTFGGPINSKGEKQARKWVERSYPLWDKWTGYLVRETLIPANQLCTDDFAGWLANNTNLALKGIIGIRAMSEISQLVEKKKEATKFREIAESYIKTWTEEYAFSRDGTHAKLAYSWFGSWTTLYNLFADSLLCFHLPSASDSLIGDSTQQPLNGISSSKKLFVDDKIYKIQSDWYHNVRQKYGLPLDSRHLYTKSDWEFFAVAIASKHVREEIIDSIALWVNETSTDRALVDLYDTEGDGGFPGINFMARPVVGGHFAYLALERACGGKAVGALDFLNDEPPRDLKVAKMLFLEEQAMELLPARQDDRRPHDSGDQGRPAMTPMVNEYGGSGDGEL